MNQAEHNLCHSYNPVTSKGGRDKIGAEEEEVKYIPDEFSVTHLDHVVNHGLTINDASRQVRPNVGRTTVNS